MKKGEFDIIWGFDYMTMVSSQNMHSVKVVNASNNVLLDAKDF